MEISKPIKVLIVDDSPVAQSLLKFIVESDPNLKVIGMAKNGEETLEMIRKEIPDVITMDIVMPGMDGFEVTRHILQRWAIPIIVVSQFYHRKDIDKCFRAMEVGALAILEKPKGMKDPRYEEMARSLVETIKDMAHMKMPKHISKKQILQTIQKDIPDHLLSGKGLDKIECVAIGASIGGPVGLSKIFEKLPATFPVPIYVVQHISGGFLLGLIEWLKSSSVLPVHLAKNGEKGLPGHIYIAPDQFHMEITKENVINLVDTPTEHGFKPSIGHLFHSVGESFGSHCVGILLSGIGKDGVEDVLNLKQKGAFTIAQDEESSVIFGKADQAIHKGGISSVLPLDQIAPVLEKLIQSSRKFTRL